MIYLLLFGALLSVAFSAYAAHRLFQTTEAQSVHIEKLRRERDTMRAAWDEANNCVRQANDSFTQQRVALVEQLRIVIRERDHLADRIGLEHRGKMLRWAPCINGERAKLAHIGSFDYWKNRSGEMVWAFFREGIKDPIYLAHARTPEECRMHAELYAHSLAGDVDDSFKHEADA